VGTAEHTDRPPPPEGGGADDRPIADVLASALVHGQALVSKEVELAKLELKEAVADKATGAALVLTAAVLGLFILAFVGVTAAKLLELVLAEWAAWLIVTGVYTLLAGVLVLVAVRRLRRPVLEETRSSLEQTAAWAREQVGR
jgi:hypothetical protein